MKMVATIVAVSIFGLLAVTPSVAQPGGDGARSGGGSVQSQPKRARPRIQVRPIYPYRRYHTTYPVPYAAEYPGPNGKRECVARYVEEHRPSGTVVVPRVNCRWVRG